MLNVLLNEKNQCIQSDWGREYQGLHKYLQAQGTAHHSLHPSAHQRTKHEHQRFAETRLALIAHAYMLVHF